MNGREIGYQGLSCSMGIPRCLAPRAIAVRSSNIRAERESYRDDLI